MGEGERGGETLQFTTPQYKSEQILFILTHDLKLQTKKS